MSTSPHAFANRSDSGRAGPGPRPGPSGAPPSGGRSLLKRAGGPGGGGRAVLSISGTPRDRGVSTSQTATGESSASGSVNLSVPGASSSAVLTGERTGGLKPTKSSISLKGTSRGGRSLLSLKTQSGTPSGSSTKNSGGASLARGARAQLGDTGAGRPIGGSIVP